MIAVIRTGGKQYLVSPGIKIKIEKLKGDEPKDSSSPSLSRKESSVKKEGSEIAFNEVLLLDLSAQAGKNKKIEIGFPLVKGVKVKGKVISQGKDKKKIAFKYKSKKRYKVKKGHRQSYTEVEIIKFETQ